MAASAVFKLWDIDCYISWWFLPSFPMHPTAYNLAVIPNMSSFGLYYRIFSNVWTGIFIFCVCIRSSEHCKLVLPILLHKVILVSKTDFLLLHRFSYRFNRIHLRILLAYYNCVVVFIRKATVQIKTVKINTWNFILYMVKIAEIWIVLYLPSYSKLIH